jgi:apolipoprotein N-acyltransferase
MHESALCYACQVRHIHKSAWLLVLLSAALQIVIFPLPNFYMLCWFAVAPHLMAILRARAPQTLQLQEGIKLLPASPWQGFVLGYVCGTVWYAGTCYWIFSTMRHYGGVSTLPALGLLILFCLYLALYHGAFGAVVAWLAGESPFSRRALLLAPAVWAAVELARDRITGFPWDLLGTTQVDNVALCRIATLTGVYGLSFEIMVVNTAMAAAFLVRRDKRKPLLLAALGAAVVLQAGRWISQPPLPTDHQAVLLQENIPVIDSADWTKEYFEDTLRDLIRASQIATLQSANGQHPNLIAWPESPAPFYPNDPVFRDALSNLARQTQTWIIAGSLGVENATTVHPTRVYNSAALVSPAGDWTARYNKAHLVPFGEYVPFRPLFGFAGGLTKEVGDFTPGTSRAPLDAGGIEVGTFICYESIFPDEIRRFADSGAQVFVNISNDGWYGDSGAYAQHLKQARMRAVENERWLLRATNTGVTASIDPYGRVVVTIPRKVRATLVAPYTLSNVTTFYTRHGDWFAFLCAIICVAALLSLVVKFPTKTEVRRRDG